MNLCEESEVLEVPLVRGEGETGEVDGAKDTDGQPLKWLHPKEHVGLGRWRLLDPVAG